MTRAGLRGGSGDDVLLPGDRRNEGAFTTLRRGLRMMPEFRRGLPATFALALVATAGRVVVPIAVQQVIDRGLSDAGADMGLVTWLVVVCAGVVLITAVAVYRMNVRLFKADRGVRNGRYMILIELDSVEDRNRIFPVEDEDGAEMLAFFKAHPTSDQAWDRFRGYEPFSGTATDYVEVTG